MAIPPQSHIGPACCCITPPPPKAGCGPCCITSLTIADVVNYSCAACNRYNETVNVFLPPPNPADEECTSIWCGGTFVDNSCWPPVFINTPLGCGVPPQPSSAKCIRVIWNGTAWEITVSIDAFYSDANTDTGDYVTARFKRTVTDCSELAEDGVIPFDSLEVNGPSHGAGCPGGPGGIGDFCNLSGATVTLGVNHTEACWKGCSDVVPDEIQVQFSLFRDAATSFQTDLNGLYYLAFEYEPGTSNQVTRPCDCDGTVGQTEPPSFNKGVDYKFFSDPLVDPERKAQIILRYEPYPDCKHEIVFERSWGSASDPGTCPTADLWYDIPYKERIDTVIPSCPGAAIAPGLVKLKFNKTSCCTEDGPAAMSMPTAPVALSAAGKPLPPYGRSKTNDLWHDLHRMAAEWEEDDDE